MRWVGRKKGEREGKRITVEEGKNDQKGITKKERQHALIDIRERMGEIELHNY